MPTSPLPLLLRKRGKTKRTASAPDGGVAASRTHTIPGDTGKSAQTARCGSSFDRKIVAQKGICALCMERFTEYSDIVPDHIHPRGMGGAWRDDHPDNIQAVHWWCNGEKGSARL